MKILSNLKYQKRKIWKKLHLNYCSYNGVILPPPEIRYMSPKFNDDKYYFDSSIHESDRLTSRLGIDQSSEILEIGSATGRMVIGLLYKLGKVKRYVGVDINTDNLNWCKHFIGRKNKCCEFIHVDMQHDKYNKQGKVRLDENFRLPFDDNSFDLIYANSVFANNLDEHIKAYSHEFARLLRSGGRLFLTAFVEENVPPMTINAENYIMKCLHPMHIVRFEKSYFLGMFTANGFVVDAYEQGAEIDKQSGMYFSKI